jgi:drug/metabolite transporter (DMT)-like permease
MMLLFVGLMAGGTFALGLSDVFRKKYLNQGLDQQALLVITLFLSGFLVLPVLLLVGFPEVRTGFWAAAVTTIALNLISQNLFIRAFKLSDASLVAPLRLIIPPLVILTGFLFLHEAPTLIGTLGIFITMAGLWFLLGNKVKLHKMLLNDRGLVYGLLGSVLFAVSFPFDKIAVVHSSALFSTFVSFTTLGVLSYLINLLFNRNFNKVLLNCFFKNLKENLLISISSSIGIVLTNQALNYSLVAYASSLKRLQALWTVIIAGRFLEEKETRRRLVATTIMFGGILLSALWK